MRKHKWSRVIQAVNSSHGSYFWAWLYFEILSVWGGKERGAAICRMCEATRAADGIEPAVLAQVVTLITVCLISLIRQCGSGWASELGSSSPLLEPALFPGEGSSFTDIIVKILCSFFCFSGAPGKLSGSQSPHVGRHNGSWREF